MDSSHHNLEMKKEEILNIIHALEPEKQVDLVNTIYETIFSEQKQILQKNEMSFKKSESIIKRFIFKVNIN